MIFSKHDHFIGTFIFHYCRMTSYSDSWFGGNVCRLFAQMYAALRMFYVFFVRLCTAFAHVVRILGTYTAYLLRKLCGFCVCIRLLCALNGFCVSIRLIFCGHCAAFAYVYGLYSRCSNADSLEGYDLASSSIFFGSCKLSWFVDSLEDPILRVLSISLSARAVCYYWTVLRIRSWGFRWFLYPR